MLLACKATYMYKGCLLVNPKTYGYIMIIPFTLERYFAKHEFSGVDLLSCSDCEPLVLNELLAMANMQSLQDWNNLPLGYTQSAGHPVLREEITKLYTSISPDQVFVLAPEEAIFIFMNVFLSKNDHVIATFPGYQSLYQIAQDIVGCTLSKWEPNNSNRFDIDELATLIKTNTKLLVLNFPHNPTGIHISASEQKKIIQLANQHGVFIFSDEMYRLLEHHPADCLPSFSDVYPFAVSLGGMSKSFALAGLRVGWILCKQKSLLKRMQVYRDYTTICNSAPSEMLSLIALQNGQAILERNRNIVRSNLRIAQTFVNNHSHLLNWHPPKAGSVGFISFKHSGSTVDFCDRVRQKSNLMLLPSEVYNYPKKGFRLGLGRKNMPALLERLSDFLNTEYPL